MSFTTITQDLQKELKPYMPQIRVLLKQSEGMAYKRITDIGFEVGKKYNVKLIVNFPHQGKIEDFDSYGTQDLSILVDMSKKKFPIERNVVKEKAKELMGDIRVEDAYMYEDKEGVKIFFEGGRIDILPHSLHIWCKFSESVTKFCDWLLVNVYLLKN